MSYHMRILLLQLFLQQFLGLHFLFVTRLTKNHIFPWDWRHTSVPLLFLYSLYLPVPRDLTLLNGHALLGWSSHIETSSLSFITL